MPVPLEELLKRTLTGDAPARELLAMGLLPVIHARVSRTAIFHGSAQTRRNIRNEVEDLTQEVCLMLFVQDCHVLRAFDASRGSLPTFVGKVAQFRTLDLLRKRCFLPRREELVDDERFFELRCVLGLEGRLEQRDLLQKVLNRVHRQLKPVTGKILEMLYVDGCSIAEVAAETDSSVSAIARQKSRLNQKLREELVTLLAEGDKRDDT